MKEVIGPEPTVAAFAQLLAELRGKRAQRRMSQRIYVLRAIDPVEPRPRGRFRVADEGDLDVIVHWVRNFLVDIGEQGDPQEISEVRVRDRKFFVWEDKVPVSMAAWAGKTPSGVRINFVYTHNYDCTPGAHLGVKFDAGLHHVSNDAHVTGRTRTRFVGSLGITYRFGWGGALP